MPSFLVQWGQKQIGKQILCLRGLVSAIHKNLSILCSEARHVGRKALSPPWMSRLEYPALLFVAGVLRKALVPHSSSDIDDKRSCHVPYLSPPWMSRLEYPALLFVAGVLTFQTTFTTHLSAHYGCFESVESWSVWLLRIMVKASTKDYTQKKSIRPCSDHCFQKWKLDEGPCYRNGAILLWHQ